MSVVVLAMAGDACASDVPDHLSPARSQGSGNHLVVQIARRERRDRYLFGDNRLEQTSDRNSAGRAEAFSFGDSTTGVVHSIWVYVDNANRAKTLKAALYTDRRGGPDVLLRSGSVSRSLKGNAWNRIRIRSVPVRAGRTYWLGVLGEGGSVGFRDRTSGPCASLTSRRGDLRSFPRSWQSGQRWNSCSISAYVKGIVSRHPITVRRPTPGLGTSLPSPGNTSPPHPVGLLPCTRQLDATNLGTNPYPGAALETAVRQADGPAVLCLSAGFPSEIDLYNLDPKSTVTIEPAPGVAASQVGSYFTLNSVSNVRLVGMTLSFLIDGNSTNDNVMDSLIDGTTFVRDTPARAKIDIAYNTATNVISSQDDAVFTVVQTGPPQCPDGVTVEHNLVDGTNVDGLATMGSACGTRFASNVVTGIIHCGSIHCDGFQDNGGGQDTVLSGNMFYDVTDCWLADDGSSNLTIENNVCKTADPSSYWGQFGGVQTLTLNHNTITSTTGATYGNDHQDDPSSNFIITNNIFYSSPAQNHGQRVSGSFTESYNMCADGCGVGSQEINGWPILAGGREPTIWSGFGLTSGSRGVGDASDGLNRGVSNFSIVPGP